MVTTSQDVLYLTVSICVAAFTGTLIWIMYYVGQITKQSNEMIADFRVKLEELDRAVKNIQEKVTHSVDVLASLSDQIGGIVEVVRSYTRGKKRNNK